MDIDIVKLGVTYESVPVFKDLSLTIEHGQFTGIIGPNGCGKSTLLKCLYRILNPYEGDIRFEGISVNNISYKESAKKISVLSQHNNIMFEMTAEDIVLMGRTPYKDITEGDNAEDYRIAHAAMLETGALDLKHSMFVDLSGGEQQRVMLARALTQETECIILDEPTNHLDITYQLQVMNLIKSRNFTVIAAIHDLNLASMYCDRIIVLKDGKIQADGTPIEVITSENIQKIYNVSASIFKHDKGYPVVVYERSL